MQNQIGLIKNRIKISAILTVVICLMDSVNICFMQSYYSMMKIVERKVGFGDLITEKKKNTFLDGESQL